MVLWNKERLRVLRCCKDPVNPSVAVQEIEGDEEPRGIMS